MCAWANFYGAAFPLPEFDSALVIETLYVLPESCFIQTKDTEE